MGPTAAALALAFGPRLCGGLSSASTRASSANRCFGGGDFLSFNKL